jgi:hypothetical protein
MTDKINLEGVDPRIQYEPFDEVQLRDLSTTLQEKIPGLAPLVDKVKAGELSLDEAMGQAMALALAQGPEIEAQVGSLLDAQILQEITDSEMLGDLFDNGVGRPQINPLVQAAMGERLQFDGDLPELRTSDLPEGVKPAVPVKTDARDAVALGVMLDRASAGIEAEIRQHQANRALAIEDLARELTQAGLIAKGGDQWAASLPNGDPDFPALASGTQLTDLPGYRRGEVPALVEVGKPTGSALAALTPEQRREAAYKFLSTTQGRRSATTTIRELVATRLSGGVFEVVEREFDVLREVEVQATHEWVVNIHGKGAIKETFNLIDTAAHALASGLLRSLPEGTQGFLYLEVTPRNTVDIRSVGWAARLVS